LKDSVQYFKKEDGLWTPTDAIWNFSQKDGDVSLYVSEPGEYKVIPISIPIVTEVREKIISIALEDPWEMNQMAFEDHGWRDFTCRFCEASYYIDSNGKLRQYLGDKKPEFVKAPKHDMDCPVVRPPE